MLSHQFKVSVGLLKFMSVLFIALPFYPFFLGWLRLEIGIVLSILLTVGLFFYAKTRNYKQFQQISTLHFFGIFCIIFVFVAFSGTGGFGFQVADYLKQNVVTRDLMQQSWPISYQLEGKTVYLAHYLGYYILAPTLVGHLGWGAVNLFNFGFTFLGFLISSFWLCRFANNFKVSFGLFFVFFGGITSISFLILHGSNSVQVLIETIKTNGHFFWLNAWDTIPLTYLGTSEQLRWSPQHTVPCGVLMGLLLNDWLIDDDVRYSPFYLSLLALWSPLVLIGFAPFLLIILIQKGFHPILNSTNFFIAPVIFFVVAMMLLSLEVGSFPSHFILNYENTIGNDLSRKIGVYCWFLVMEVGVWWLPVYLILRKRLASTENLVLIFTGILLSLIPLYRYGLWNDWCGRVSFPALFILFAFVWKAFSETTVRWQAVLIGILVMGSMTPLAQFAGSLRMSGYRIKMNPPALASLPTLQEICVGYSIDQFVAKDNTFFYKYIAKIKKSNPK